MISSERKDAIIKMLTKAQMLDTFIYVCGHKDCNTTDVLRDSVRTISATRNEDLKILEEVGLISSSKNGNIRTWKATEYGEEVGSLLDTLFDRISESSYYAVHKRGEMWQYIHDSKRATKEFVEYGKTHNIEASPDDHLIISLNDIPEPYIKEIGSFLSNFGTIKKTAITGTYADDYSEDAEIYHYYEILLHCADTPEKTADALKDAIARTEGGGIDMSITDAKNGRIWNTNLLCIFNEYFNKELEKEEEKERQRKKKESQ